RRYAEPRWNDAGAEAAGNDQVAVVLDHMAIGEARAVLRRHEMRPNKRHANLSAVGVTGERERDTRRHFRKNIRLVDQEHHRIVGLDPRQRTRQIIDAAKHALTNYMSELIADPGEPDPLSRRANEDGIVFEHRN